MITNGESGVILLCFTVFSNNNWSESGTTLASGFVNFSGKLYNFVSYGLNKKTGRVDFNQLYKFQDIISKPREIHAIECDIKYELFDSFLSSINLIGEMVAISYPEKRYYTRRDDDLFSNDKKSRNGSWGIAFPGIELKSMVETECVWS